MNTLFRDDSDTKRHFSWIKKDYVEDKENKKLEDEHDKGNIYNDEKSETD